MEDDDLMAIWSILRPFGRFCGHLVYFVAIWSILWPFGLFCGHLVYFVDICAENSCFV
jgi:hypothetical protein